MDSGKILTADDCSSEAHSDREHRKEQHGRWGNYLKQNKKQSYRFRR